MVWIVAQTQPLSEARALRHLVRQGFTCYAPRFFEERTQLEGFLFPRYLFVWMTDQWRAIRESFGVTSLLQGSVSEKVICGLQASEKNGMIVLSEKRFRVGQRVKIYHGQFEGYYGLYQGMSSRQREVVLLDMLGRVELRNGDLDV